LTRGDYMLHNSFAPQEKRLKRLCDIIKVDNTERYEIVKNRLENVLKNQVPHSIQADLETIVESGSLIDYAVAYNMIYDMDIHLHYQKERLKHGQEAINDKQADIFRQKLYEDIQNEGNFYKVLRHNLERRQRLVKRVVGGTSAWREVALLQKQLGNKPFTEQSEKVKSLEQKLDMYVLDNELFKKDVLEAFPKLTSFNNQNIIHFLLKLSFGEEVIYQKVKEKAYALLERDRDNLLFQKSERGFPYLFKLFYGQEHKGVIKMGIDPTNPDLHLGHVVPLNVLHEFQKLGYNITIILGDRTARVGDPSGRSKERPRLTFNQIARNVEKYKDQILKVLDMNRTNFVYNSTWLDSLKGDCWDKIYEKFKITDLTIRTDFKKRIDKGISPTLLEGIYPVLQSTDSLFLGSVVEMGGQDQLINMMYARRLQEQFNLETQLILFTPLLLGIKGKRKMSKSLNNHISINDPPEEMYTKIMGLSDYLLFNYYELLVDQDECFKDVPANLRKDLFEAFGGLNLLIDYANKVVKENRIKKKEENRDLLQKLHEGNELSLPDEYREFIYAVERQISRKGRKIDEHYKPHYIQKANYKRRIPVKIKGKDHQTKDIINTLMSYEKISDDSTYNPQNLGQRFARYIIEKYHGKEGLRALDESLETTAETPIVDLNDFFEDGRLLLNKFTKNLFGITPKDMAQKAKQGLVYVNGQLLGTRSVKNGLLPEFDFKPGKRYDVQFGKKEIILMYNQKN